MKRSAVLIAAVTLLLTGCSLSDGEKKTSVVQPPFWVAEHPESGAVIYMLGSMHVGEEGAVYPDYVTEAFESCSTLAVELDSDSYSYEELVSASKYLLMPEGLTAEQCFGDDYDKVVDFLKEKDVYHRTLEQFTPYYWASSLTMLIAEDCGLLSEYGTETVFRSMAKEQGKEIVEIESLSEQYAMMAEIPMSVQVETVLSGIGEENYAEQVAVTREMYEDWASFDSEGLESLDEEAEGVSQELQTDYIIFNDMMYNDRQKRMAEFAADCLENGEDVFMTVGAAHFFVGEDIISLLEQKGYIVREVRE